MAGVAVAIVEVVVMPIDIRTQGLSAFLRQAKTSQAK